MEKVLRKVILSVSVIILLVGTALYTRSSILQKNKQDSLKAWENDIADFVRQALDMGFAATDGNIIVVPATCMAEEIEWVNIHSSAPEDGWLLFTHTEEGKDKQEIVIPETIDGKPITAINVCAFFRCRNLESVIIPDTICNVAENAFSACHKLRSITSSAEFFNAVGGVNSPIFAECNISEWNYSGDGLEFEFGFAPLE